MQYSARRRSFEKTRAIVVLHLVYNPSTFHPRSHIITHGAPYRKPQKNAVFAHFGIIFNQIAGTSQVPKEEVILFLNPPASSSSEKELK